jgi:hypothetical protein
MTRASIRTSVKLIAVAVMAIALIVPASVSAAPATSAQVREAQTLLTKLKIPAGPVDGMYGGQTGRGLCTFRLISGLSVTRSNVDSALLAKLRGYAKTYASLQAIPAPTRAGENTYLLVHEACQIMLYVENGKYVRAIPVSTGMKGHGTPNDTYRLDNTQLGWSCSTIWPGGCRTQTTGKYRNYSSYGNMYNKRQFKGDYLVHGSTSVPTYPASHGCVRVPIADSDWMYANVGNDRDPLFIVTGTY